MYLTPISHFRRLFNLILISTELQLETIHKKIFLREAYILLYKKIMWTNLNAIFLFGKITKKLKYILFI